MPDSLPLTGSDPVVPNPRGEDSPQTPRHPLTVRVTHWLTALCFLALLITGVEIVISHPRFYWGEEGNVNTPALFSIPIPASRSSVPTGYGYVLPDQNGWSRSLHFQSGWLLVGAGLVYFLFSVASGHLRKNLLPNKSSLSWESLSKIIWNSIRFKSEGEKTEYNPLQRVTYLGVVYVAFPLMVWTGLAMSPAVTSAFPFLVNSLGGHQSARTLHFFATILLALFTLVHVLMVYVSGFRKRTRAMIVGN